LAATGLLAEDLKTVHLRYAMIGQRFVKAIKGGETNLAACRAALLRIIERDNIVVTGRELAQAHTSALSPFSVNQIADAWMDEARQTVEHVRMGLLYGPDARYELNQRILSDQALHGHGDVIYRVAIEADKIIDGQIGELDIGIVILDAIRPLAGKPLGQIMLAAYRAADGRMRSKDVEKIARALV
jgi:hypothetical protein